MRDAGFPADSPRDLLYCMILLSIVNTVGNFIGISLSSRYGRRELILKSTIPMGIALFILTAMMIINSIMVIDGSSE